MKCRRHSWVWIPRSAATQFDHSNGNLIVMDLGKCQKCGHYTSRVFVYTPADQMLAEIWGEGKFEVIRRTE
jgi:hypothetical protein